MTPVHTAAAPQPKPKSAFIDSATFASKSYKHGWLVEQIFVQGQPGVVGGPKKSLKTSLVLDLAVSLGTGTPFLGEFAVPKPRRVAVFSGESGHATIQETARRICKAKGVSLADCDVLWSFTLPRLHDDQALKTLNQAIRDGGVQVVFIDPLYLCLLDGGAGSASNLYEVGPILRRATMACLNAGATPVFVHHATKSGGKQAASAIKPLELDDLQFSGVSEFVRQWLLVSRAEPYQPGTGRHSLLLAAGGSAGQSGCWHLDIGEGVVGDDFQGRKWRVMVRDAEEVVQQMHLAAAENCKH